MTGAGMRRYNAYGRTVTVDQQHTCQAASGGTGRGASFPTATAARVGSGARRLLRGLTPHDVTEEHGAG